MLLSYIGRAISFGLTMSLILLSVVVGAAPPASRQRSVRAAGVLLAILGAAGLIVTIGSATLAADYRLLTFTLMVALCSLGLGIVVTLLEVRYRRAHPKAKHGLPFGALIIGIGALGLVSNFIVPAIPSQLAPIEVSAATPIQTATAAHTPLPTRTPRVSVTVTIPPTNTSRPTTLPTLTLTPPRTTPTAIEITPLSTTFASTGSATARSAPNAETVTPGACRVTVNKNVNLRVSASADSQLLTTIPFGTVLQGLGQVKGWWQVRFGNQEGWVTRDATTGSAECAALPTQTP